VTHPEGLRAPLTHAGGGDWDPAPADGAGADTGAGDSWGGGDDAGGATSGV
jgi:hypothetical protein